MCGFDENSATMTEDERVLELASSIIHAISVSFGCWSCILRSWLLLRSCLIFFIDARGRFFCQGRERKPSHSCTNIGISSHSEYVAVANLQKKPSILLIRLVYCVISLLRCQFNCSPSDFTKVMNSSLANRFSYQLEIQSIVPLWNWKQVPLYWH